MASKPWTARTHDWLGHRCLCANAAVARSVGRPQRLDGSRMQQHGCTSIARLVHRLESAGTQPRQLMRSLRHIGRLSGPRVKQVSCVGESPSWLRHWILIPACEGSNPSSPAKSVIRNKPETARATYRNKPTLFAGSHMQAPTPPDFMVFTGNANQGG